MEYYKRIYGYKINLDENRFISIDTYRDEKSIWNDVSFNDKGNITFLGTYYSYSDSVREWIEYNSDFIALVYTTENNNFDIHIKSLYDIEKNIFIIGSEEELISYYNDKFKYKKLIRRHS